MPQRGERHRQGVVGVVLVRSTVAQQPCPRRQRGRHVDDVLVGGDELLRQQEPETLGSLDRPSPRGERLRPRQQPADLVAAAAHLQPGELDLAMTDRHRGVRCLSHHGGDCTFETMLRHFDLDDVVLWDMARIVHEADLADDRFDAAEVAGFDYANMDPTRHRLYVSHLGASRIVVVNTVGPTVSASSTTCPAGILAVPALNRMYAAATGSDQAVTDDATTLTELNHTTGRTPNELAYNTDTNAVYLSNEAGPTVTEIDATTRSPTARSTSAAKPATSPTTPPATMCSSTSRPATTSPSSSRLEAP